MDFELAGGITDVETITAGRGIRDLPRFTTCMATGLLEEDERHGPGRQRAVRRDSGNGGRSEVAIRAYGPLNDFLPRGQRQLASIVRFGGSRSVKDVIEALGIPHPEIAVILVNGDSSAFETPARDGDRLAVFPRFYAIDIPPVTRVRLAPPHLASAGARVRAPEVVRYFR